MRYQREDACRAWLTYGYLAYDALRDLLETHGSAEAIYERFGRDGPGFLSKMAKPEQIEALRRQADGEQMHQMLLTMQRLNMGILSLDDYSYPEDLLNISDPPVFLYWQGDLECLKRRCVTMVGSRSASIPALEATRQVACELSNQGVTIVSGLANGIDQAAHQGCMKGASPTAGVLACGLDVDYPSGSSKLKREILEGGGVLLSEYPPGVPAISWHFPVRNRILSGLSRAVLMMECRLRSGSMTTVQHALDQGREVFAWPGVAGSPWAEGAHQLLREGARYFTCAKDVMEDMGWEGMPLPSREQVASLPPLTPDQKQVYQQLKRGEQSMDELTLATGMDAAQLTGALTMLQLLGLIRALPGKRYQIV